MDRYIHFWEWFEQHSDELRRLLQDGRADEVANQVSTAIDQVDPDLAWELGPGKHDQLSLTISAEGDSRLRKIVDALFENRPTLPGWEIHDCRQPKSLDVVNQILSSQGYLVDLTKVGITPELALSKTRVNLTVYSVDFVAVPESARPSVVFSILDGLLGEEMVETWIGEVKIEPTGQRSSIPLPSLPDFMRELISAQ